MFKKATRLKLRFESTRGALTTEDLFDLPLTSKEGFDLDTIAKGVNKEIKTSEEESFVKASTVTSMVNTLRLDILKNIIATKLEEAAAATSKIENEEKRKKILAAIANKQEHEFSEKSLEELNADLKALN